MNEQNTLNQEKGPLPRSVAIAPFTSKQVLSKRKLNEIVARLNPLLNIKVISGNAFQIIYSDANVLIVVPGAVSDSSGGPPPPPPPPPAPGMRWRGTYNATYNYVRGDVVIYNIDSNRVSWVCDVTNGPGTANGAQTPTWVEPSPAYWIALCQPMNRFTLNYKDYADSCNAKSQDLFVPP